MKLRRFATLLAAVWMGGTGLALPGLAAPISRMSVFDGQAGQPSDGMTPEEKKALEAKAVALVGQIVTDASQLRLPENRIQILSFAAEVLWKRDEPRGRGYLQDAISQFMGMEPLLSDSGARAQQAWRDRSMLRSNLIQTASKLDARMALDFLRASRQSLAKSSAAMGVDPKASQEYEKNYEMQLAVQIAENDPHTALQLAREVLRQDPNYQVVEIWRRLLNKDPQSAQQLSSELLARLKTADGVRAMNSLNLVNEMVYELRRRMQEGNRAKDARGNGPSSAELEAGYRDLLDYIATAALKITTANLMDVQEQGPARNLLGQARSLLPEMEKYLGAKATQVRTKLSQFDKAYYHPPTVLENFEELEKKSATELVALAEKAKAEEKDMLYSQAVMRALQEGNTDLAKQVSRQFIKADGQNEFLSREIERVEREKAIKDGKVDEARKGLDRIQSDSERVMALIALASQARAGKNVQTQKQLLDEARALLGEKMDTRSQVEAQLSLAAAYLPFDADYGFGTLDAAIEKLNSVMTSTIMLMKFTQELPAEEEEMRVNQNVLSNILTGDLDTQLLAFARKDFGRTQTSLEHWQNVQVRLALNMALVATILGTDERRGESMSPGLIYRRDQ